MSSCQKPADTFHLKGNSKAYEAKGGLFEWDLALQTFANQSQLVKRV